MRKEVSRGGSNGFFRGRKRNKKLKAKDFLRGKVKNEKGLKLDFSF